jgi:5-methylcytosine-specific restriction endonuclease McrA
MVSAAPAGGAAGGAGLLVTTMLDALDLRDAAPRLTVRDWFVPRAATIKQPRSYAICVAAARVALGASPSCRLYWFPAAVEVSQRQALRDEASFARFQAYCHAAMAPELWVYDETATGKAGSPATEPAVATPQQPAAPSATSGSARSSGLQANFRDMVCSRDGDTCVFCGSSSNLEAAHVVARDSPRAILAVAGLLSPWEPTNGILLCSTCHKYYDRSLWRVHPDGTVEVAQSLLDRPDADAEHFRRLHGRPLRQPASEDLLAAWPPPKRWAVQSQKFEAARELRHDMLDANPEQCLRCGMLFVSADALTAHTRRPRACERRVERGQRMFFTLLERRAFARLPAVMADEPLRQPVFEAADGEEEDGSTVGGSDASGNYDQSSSKH